MEYSLFGAWADSQERFAEVYDVAPMSPSMAESQAQAMAKREGGTLWVCRIFSGRQEPKDTYTLFTDPRDPRNADADVELDTPDFTRDSPGWEVIGFAVPKGMAMLHPEFGHTAERHAELIYAPSPLIAEDAARDRLAEKGADFIVCTVLDADGLPPAADTYATFADPDRKPG